MAVMEDELQRLWQLLAELSSQLTQNREQCEHLKKQAEDLKTQAIHTGTGYALKRFNVDLSQEQFESEVERMNAQLVVENQTLQHENRQLTVLLKDHETTLEQIMTRFRNHAHSTQQHELELTKYYESVILSIMEKQQQQQQQTSHLMINYQDYQDGHQMGELDPNLFQVIQNISILIQKAMRELSGEEPYLNELDELESQQAELESQQASQLLDHAQKSLNTQHHSPLAQSSTTSSPSDPIVSFHHPFKPLLQVPDNSKAEDALRRKSASVIDLRPRIQDPSKGGYVGKRTGSFSDHALLSAIECERLRRENEYLREMLGIAVESNPTTLGSQSNNSDSSGAGNLAEGGIQDGHSTLSKQNESDSMRKFVNHELVSEVIKEEDEQPESEPAQQDQNDSQDDPPQQLDSSHQDPWNENHESGEGAWDSSDTSQSDDPTNQT